jgi:hypothetical protein
MVNVPKAKIYKCKRCDKEWLQRVLAKYSEDGKSIKKVIASPKPQNCTDCKSPSWEIPRS